MGYMPIDISDIAGLAFLARARPFLRGRAFAFFAFRRGFALAFRLALRFGFALALRALAFRFGFALAFARRFGRAFALALPFGLAFRLAFIALIQKPPFIAPRGTIRTSRIANQPG